MTRTFLAVLSVVAMAAMACGESVSDAPADTAAPLGPECMHDPDCPADQACAFQLGDECGVKGHCVRKTGKCPFSRGGCGCDGSLFGDGPYLPSPPVYDSACKPLRCSADKACPSWLSCAYRASDGCSATGYCVYRFTNNFCMRPPSRFCACNGSFYYENMSLPLDLAEVPIAPDDVRCFLSGADAGSDGDGGSD